MSWTRRTAGITAWLTTVVYVSARDRFFAVGEGGPILSSSDGVAWVRETSPTTIRLNGVGPGSIGGTLWAVGEPGAGLLVRDAAGTWTRTDPGFGDRWMRGLLYNTAFGLGGAIFAATVSYAGTAPTTTWERVVSPVAADLEAATNGAMHGGWPVAVGADGTILQWTGESWVARPSGTTERLRGICYRAGGLVRLVTMTYSINLGEYFAVGTGGTILRSGDGALWQRDSAPTARNLNAVCQTASYVVAVVD